MHQAILIIVITGCCFIEARGQDTVRSIPIVKLEFGAGFSPLGVGNGLGVRTAVSVFPTRLGLIARATSHASDSDRRSGLLSLGPAKRRIVDRAIMLGWHVQSEADAVFIAALGLGQLWGERLAKDNSSFVKLERRLGLAAEIGAYMPTGKSGVGTVILGSYTANGYVVGFVVTFFVGF